MSNTKDYLIAMASPDLIGLCEQHIRHAAQKDGIVIDGAERKEWAERSDLYWLAYRCKVDG